MTITNQNIDDILCCAFEGGINYWAGKAEPKDGFPDGAEFASEIPSRGGEIILHHDDPNEGDEGEFSARSTIDRGTIEGGIVKAAKQRGKSVEAFLEDHDADDADLAVQFAIFGEVIFG